MILSYFFSSLNHDNSNPHEIMSISFNMQEVLHSRYYNVHETKKNILLKLDLKLILVVQIC